MLIENIYNIYFYGELMFNYHHYDPRPSGRLTKLVARTVHGNQGWVRFPSRAPHLPGVVTYNAVLLPCLNAKIRMSVDVLCRMKSPFMSLVAHSIGAARI